MTVTGVNKDAVVTLALEGRWQKHILRELGLSYYALQKALTEDADFAKAYRHARRLGFELKAEDLDTLVEDHPELDAGKLRIVSDNRKWILAHLEPEKYGDRLELNVTEKVDIKGAIIESKARMRVINPELLSNNPLE